jgi:hypothetical protein
MMREIKFAAGASHMNDGTTKEAAQSLAVFSREAGVSIAIWYDVPNPKDHNYGDPPRDYPEIEPGDVDAYGRTYCWDVRANSDEPQ